MYQLPLVTDDQNDPSKILINFKDLARSFTTLSATKQLVFSPSINQTGNFTIQIVLLEANTSVPLSTTYWLNLTVSPNLTKAYKQQLVPNTSISSTDLDKKNYFTKNLGNYKLDLKITKIDQFGFVSAEFTDSIEVLANLSLVHQLLRLKVFEDGLPVNGSITAFDVKNLSAKNLYLSLEFKNKLNISQSKKSYLQIEIANSSYFESTNTGAQLSKGYLTNIVFIPT